MSRLPTPGSDDGTWGGILNDYLSVSLDVDGTLKASAVSNKANDSVVVHNTGNESVAGVKTFTSSPVVPTPSAGTDTANKVYVDGIVAGKEATANKGTAGGYAPLDGSSKLPLANLPQLALMLPPFTQAGSLSVATGTIRLPIDGVYAVTGVRLMVGTAPVGADIIIDILKNGSTIFTTSGNRPSITAGSSAGGPGAAPDVPALAAGDYLTVNIAQVGSTTPGSDLVVTVLALRTQ